MFHPLYPSKNEGKRASMKKEKGDQGWRKKGEKGAISHPCRLLI
jgi:hypothetical protein